MFDTFFRSLFEVTPAMVILRGFSPDRAVDLAERAWDVGLTTVEIPLQRAADALSIERASARARERGLCIGAGTILDVAGARRAREAGAAFTVAPGFSAGVWADAVETALPHLPGVATATEVQTALAAGAQWLKAFPAARLGPEWFRDMRGPFPDARFVATGGVDAANADALREAGADVVAFGSAVADAAALAELAGIARERAAARSR